MLCYFSGVIQHSSRIENFKLLGINFRRGKVEINADNNVKLELQKLLGKREYLQFAFKEEDFLEHNETSLSFIKELQNPKSKIILTYPLKRSFARPREQIFSSN